MSKLSTLRKVALATNGDQESEAPHALSFNPSPKKTVQRTQHELISDQHTPGASIPLAAVSNGILRKASQLGRWWKVGILGAALALLGGQVNAQVSSYTFGQSSGTYTAITGGTNLTGFTSTTTYVDDNVSTTLAPIGFTFTYNGTAYTQFGYNANGFITLGALPISSYFALSSGSSNNVIAAMNNDLICRGSLSINRTAGSPTVTVTGGDIALIQVGDRVSGSGLTTASTVVSKTSTTVTLSANASGTGTGSHMRFVSANTGIRYETIGTAPNRTLVVQWTGFQRFTTTGAFGELYNFQIRLQETTNVISVVYNILGPTSTTSTTYQIGLRGASSADFNNRTTTTNWASTVAGSSNSATVTLRNTVKPASGLTYTWTPASGCTGSPNAGTASGPASSCSGQSFTLNATGLTAGPGISYQWRRSTDGGGTWNNIAGATTATVTVSQTVATQYRITTTCSNSGSSSNSNEVSVGMAAFIACYCGGALPTAATDDATGLTFVGFNTIAQASLGTPAYTDQSAVSTSVIVGSAYALSARVNTAGNFTVNTKAWIDWDQNGAFDAAEEYNLGLATNVTDGASSFSPLSVTVPSGAVLGNTRMRVRATYNVQPTACGDQSYSEAEDYTITVQAIPPCSGQPNAGTASASVPSVCSGVNFTLSATGLTTFGTGLSYQWQSSTDGVSYSNIPLATGTTATVSQTETTQYRIRTTCASSGLSNFSSAVTVITAPLSASITGNNFYCTGGSTTLTAVPSGGAGPFTYTWSTGATGTAAISVSAAGDYSCQVTDACGASVNTGNFSISEAPAPSAPTSVVATTASTINLGGTVSFSADPGGQSMNWYDQSTGGTSLGTSTTITTPVRCATGAYSYYAETQLGSCFSARVPVNFTVRPLLASDPANGLICSAGGSVGLTANAVNASSISWTPATGLSSTNQLAITASPTTTTQYSFSATVAGCGAVGGNITMGVIPGASFTPTYTPDPLCAGANVTLNSNLSSSNFSVASTTFAPATQPGSGVTTLASGGVAVVPVSGGNTDDGGWANIPIGFTYNFFGSNFTSLAVGTNGLVMFGTVPGYTTAAGQLGQYAFLGPPVFPNAGNPGNVIGLMLSDMNFANTNSSLRYWTDGIAPTRRFILSGTYSTYSTSTVTTVQMMLYETTGIVEVHITSSTSTTARTVGLQDATKTIGAIAPGWSSRTTTLGTPEAWRFSPAASYSFQWLSAGTPISGATSGTYGLTAPTTPGTYSYAVQATNPNTGCTSTQPLSLAVNPLPTAPSATTAYTYCQYTTAPALTATAESGNTLLWYTQETGGTGSSTAPVPSTATPGSTTWYVAQVTPSTCEGPRTAITVQVNPAPDAPSVTTPVAYCQGDVPSALSATADAGNSLLWYTVPTGGTGTTTAITPSTASAGSTPYYVAQVSGTNSCESLRATITVNVTAVPNAPGVTSPVTYCEGATASELTATGDGLQWFTVQTGGTALGAAPTPSTSASGTTSYFVSQTVSGCTSIRAQIDVVVEPFVTPSVGISASSTSACGGGGITFTATPGNGGASPTYQWYLNNAAVSGETNATYVLASPAVDDAVYVTMVSNATGCITTPNATSNTVTLTGDAATPTVAIAASVSGAICPGTSVTFSVQSSANMGGGPSYQWRLNGSPISGETAATYTTTTLAPGDAVSLEMTSSLAPACLTTTSATSNAVSFSFNAATTILTQPTAQAVCDGTNASFSVSATGQGALSYQWSRNGVAVSGNATAITPSLVVSAVGAGNLGNYTVAVTGLCGTVTSSAAALTLNTATAITTQPAAVTACTGSPASLSVVATGSGTVSYQWRKAGVDISGATDATLSFPSLSASDAAAYTVVVTAGCGAVTSSSALVTVQPSTQITAQPVAATVCAGSAANFSVTASGTAPFTYQWFLNGTAIDGASASVYSIASASAGVAGQYSVVVNGSCGSATSNNALLTVNEAPSISAQPASQTICFGSPVTFSVAAAGAGLSYQWRYGSTDIPGASSSSYTIASVDNSAAGSYSVRITGTCGTLTSSAALLTVPTCAWYSQSSGGVNDPVWSAAPIGTPGNAVWTAASNMVVQNGNTVTTAGSTDINTLNVEAGGTLVLAASSILSVNGATVTFAGTVTAADNSTLALVGSSATTLSSTASLSLYDLTVNTPAGTTTAATISMRGTLSLQAGAFDATAANITLVSNAAGTARLGPVGVTADYVGNTLTVQRYIPAGLTNWRLLGSPVAGQNVDSWDDDFITAGFPGSDYPNFFDPPGSGILWSSVRDYVEGLEGTDPNTGVVSVESAASPLVAGKGFAVWAGDNFSTTAAFTIDVTGDPFVANTPITLPLTYTNNSAPLADGWNLVSNPLASPISFSAISRGANVLNQYYIFDPAAGNNIAWTNGIGQGGANGTIQSSQGFWMRTNGAAVTTTVSESAKVLAPTGGVFGGGDQEPAFPMLRLSITGDQNTFRDESMVIFEQGSPAYDEIDATKLVFAHAQAPQLATLSSDGRDLAIDFHGAYVDALTIPVTVKAGVTGMYTITVGLNGITSLGCLSLEDLTTGTITPIADGASYTFALEATTEPVQRFIIHGSVPMTLDVLDATCGGVNNGQATVNVPAGPVDITWTDAFGNVLLQQNGISAGTATFGGIGVGSYTVRVNSGEVCGELVSDFGITAPFVLEAAVEAMGSSSCPNTDDGTLDMLVLGGTAPYDYSWSNGADTEDLVAGPGTYTLVVTDANGCEWMSTPLEIASGAGPVAGITADELTVVNAPVAFVSTSALADGWAWDFGDGATSTEAAPVHVYSLPGVYTVTLVVTYGGCSDVATFEVSVEQNVGVGSLTSGAGVRAWAAMDHIMVEHAFTGAVQVELLDATGRLEHSQGSTSGPGVIVLQGNDLAAGIWFVRITHAGEQHTVRVPLMR